MTAKSKAFQAMAVISIAALTYTLSHSPSEEAATNDVPVVSATMDPVIITTKSKKEKATPEPSVNYNQGSVPGYSNPDENCR